MHQRSFRPVPVVLASYQAGRLLRVAQLNLAAAAGLFLLFARPHKGEEKQSGQQNSTDMLPRCGVVVRIMVHGHRRKFSG